MRSVKIDQLQASFKSFEELLNGSENNDWHAIRTKAFENLESKGLPTNKAEDYKYTNLGKVFQRLEPNQFATGAESFDVTPFLFQENENRLVFIDGVLDQKNSKILDQNIRISNLSEADPDVLLEYFGSAGSNEDTFTELNTAFAKSGAFIEVGKSVTVDHPIALYYLNTGNNRFSQPRNLMIFGENSEATITAFHHMTGEGESWENSVTEIFVGKQARVRFHRLEPYLTGQVILGHTFVRQDADSNFTSVMVTTGAKTSRNNLTITQLGEHCETHMYGLTLGNGKQHIDHKTIVDHTEPNSESNELYKFIMDDQSTGVFNGRIYVRQYAQKTNAFQSNRNILLSDDATINTKPQLEIWADDVKCSHGATTGQIDEDQLFYLRARGLDETTARAMLLYAFANDVLNHIRLDSVRGKLDEIISERLHKNF